MTTHEEAKILVVDDEEIIRIGCLRILEETYANVMMAENGRKGWECFSQGGFDLVLLDLMMPEMSGLELIDKIRQTDSEVVIIVITGYATIETAVDAMRKGAYDYLPKPFTPEDLRSKVHRALEKRWLTQQAEQLRQERDRNLLECANEKSRTATILNCLSEGLIATNRTGQIVLMNPTAMNIIRPKIVPVIGRTVSGLLGNPDLEQQISETLDTVARTVTVKRMEIPTSDGRTLQSHISPIIDDRGECLGTVTVLLDITQDKKLEKIKSDFVRLVSHELKSPVAAIAGYLNLIVDGLTAKQPEKEKEIILRSRDKANSLLDLINDLLDLSRADRAQKAKTMSPLDLAPILQEAVQFYQNDALQKQIALELFCAGPLPPVLGDSEELSRVFANLISNAIKYTPPDGRVRVGVEKRDAQIVISVTDTGMGISREEQKKVFDEFFRGHDAIAGKIAGTGLGLAIAKKIVEAHRGYLELESELHQGSTFRVILPVAETRTV